MPGHVLCATDLSEFGNRALPHAHALAAPGGRVHLVTVLVTPATPSPLVPRYGEKRASDDELAARERTASETLGALARSVAGTHGVDCDARVLRGAHVATAVLEEAERIAASALCLATHSRSGLAKLILGSTAQELIQRGGLPILLVPSPLGG